MNWTNTLLVVGLCLAARVHSDDRKTPKPDDPLGPGGESPSSDMIAPVRAGLLDRRESAESLGRLGIPIHPESTDPTTRPPQGGGDSRNLIFPMDDGIIAIENIGPEPILDRKTKSLLDGAGNTGGVPVLNPTLYEQRGALRDVLESVNDVVSVRTEGLVGAPNSGPQETGGFIAVSFEDRTHDAMDNMISDNFDRRADLADELVDNVRDRTDNLRDGMSDIGETVSESSLELLDSRKDMLSDITDNVQDTLSDISDRRQERLDNRQDIIENQQEIVGEIIDNANDNLDHVVDNFVTRADSKQDIIENIADIRNDVTENLNELVENKIDRVTESRDERLDNMIGGIKDMIDRRQDFVEERVEKISDRLDNYGDMYDGKGAWLKEAVERELDRLDGLDDIKDSSDFWDDYLDSDEKRYLNSKSILNLSYRFGKRTKRKPRINVRVPRIRGFPKAKKESQELPKPVIFNKYNWYPNRYAIGTTSNKKIKPKVHIINKSVRVSLKSKDNDDDDDDDKTMNVEIKTKVDGTRENSKARTASLNIRNPVRRRTQPTSQTIRRGIPSRRRRVYTNPRQSFRPPITRRTDRRRPPFGMRPGPEFGPRPRRFPYPMRDPFFRPPPFGDPFTYVPRPMPFGPPMVPF